jgi:1-acyl-sn-glycerol-3-phosphate acyltransferase
MRSLPRLLAAGTRLFYRLELAGRAPAAGPVLFVANHPNSLLDPALVSLAAGREVRFLAKHTLFDDRKVGWLVRAAGSVPVYRQQDGPGARPAATTPCSRPRAPCSPAAAPSACSARG